jgi:hypothetical protein
VIDLDEKSQNDREKYKSSTQNKGDSPKSPKSPKKMRGKWGKWGNPLCFVLTITKNLRVIEKK